MGRYLRDILSAPIMINNDRILANAEAAVLMSEPPVWLSALKRAASFSQPSGTADMTVSPSDACIRRATSVGGNSRQAVPPDRRRRRP